MCIFSAIFLSIDKCRQNIVSSPPQNEDGDNSGQVDKISLVLHGTKQVPTHVLRAGGKRHYDYSYNNVHNERDVSIIIVQATADGGVTRLPVWPNVCQNPGLKNHRSGLFWVLLKIFVKSPKKCTCLRFFNRNQKSPELKLYL